MRDSQQHADENDWQLCVCKCVLGAAAAISRPIVHRVQDQEEEGHSIRPGIGRGYNLVFKMPNPAGNRKRIQRLPECGCPSHKLAWLPLRSWSESGHVHTGPLFIPAQSVELATNLRRSFHNYEEGPLPILLCAQPLW